ncbi:MAG: VPLPA-CTERM sorting domain-containing protein [Pseudomonadota bacterium]
MKKENFQRLFSVFINAILALFFLFAGNAASAPIGGLMNTGVDAMGVVLASGSMEINYANTFSAVVNPTPGSPSWVSAPGDAEWIGPDGGGAEGSFLYTLTFDLSGLDPSTAIITGNWSIDNTGEIYLNGVWTGVELTSATSFSTLHSFTINSGFVEGLNTLIFDVTNAGSGSPTGLIVSGMSGTADPVPIPAAMWLFGSGLIGLISIRRRLNN